MGLYSVYASSFYRIHHTQQNHYILLTMQDHSYNSALQKEHSDHNNVHDVAIIGAGPVGLFTVFTCGMQGMRAAVCDVLPVVGGQCIELYPDKPIYDIPGFPSISARELTERLVEQGKPFRPTYHLSRYVYTIEEVSGCASQCLEGAEDGEKSKIALHNDASAPSIFRLYDRDHHHICDAKSVVLALGYGAFCPRRPQLNHPQDQQTLDNFENKAIFYRVTRPQDFADQDIVIVGGGDSAVDWALLLCTQYHARVTLVHRRDHFRCAPHAFEALREAEEKGVLFILRSYEIDGFDVSAEQTTVIQGVYLRTTLSGGTKERKHVSCEKILFCLGLVHQTDALRAWNLEQKRDAVLAQPPHYVSSRDGIFAIGDCASYDGKLKLIATGFAESFAVARGVFRRVFPKKMLSSAHSTTKGVVPI